MRFSAYKVCVRCPLLFIDSARTISYLLANHWQYSAADTILKLNILIIITQTFVDDGHMIESLDL